jgi:hypothetical protein
MRSAALSSAKQGCFCASLLYWLLCLCFVGTVKAGSTPSSFCRSSVVSSRLSITTEIMAKKKNNKNKKKPQSAPAAAPVASTKEQTEAVAQNVVDLVAAAAETVVPAVEQLIDDVLDDIPDMDAPRDTNVWNTNEAVSQEELMDMDQVLVVNEQDVITGTMSKKDSHVFSAEQPHGILHRAFSLFVFCQDTQELLLQQRASSKITFPGVRILSILHFC